MPPKSKKQRRLMGTALSIKRGETPASYSPEAARLARTMTEEQLEEYAGVPEKKLPTRVKPNRPRQPKRRRVGLAETARRQQRRMRNPQPVPRTARNRLSRLSVKK